MKPPKNNEELWSGPNRRVPTKDNTSDVFTKTLGTEDIVRLRPGLTGYGPLPVVPESMPT